jgi:uncharacterized protein YbjT (DUF2867 family)
VHVQAISADDVAAAVAHFTLGAPLNGMTEIAGPERVGLATLVRRYLNAIGDEREVMSDADALYFGVRLNDQSLTPDAQPRLDKVGLKPGWRSRRKPHEPNQ